MEDLFMGNINPLTQDQLKEMTGKWVKIVLLDETNTTTFAFVTSTGLSTFLGYNSDKYCVIADFTFDECGKEFEAYSVEEKRIDREKWTTEWKIKKSPWNGHTMVCSKCGDTIKSLSGQLDFCPSCGRATTLKVWKELEQRLMG